MSSSRLHLLATVAAGALALTACGSGQDTVASPSADASASSTASPVCPLPSPVQVEPPAEASADLAVKPVVAPASVPPPKELQYADIVVGTGAEAVTGSQVEVKYVGAFFDTGKEFDSSWSRGAEETIPFGICRQGVIPGFAVGPTGMKIGGRRLILIPSRLGYGPDGNPPTIPADAALVFVVDLVSVT